MNEEKLYEAIGRLYVDLLSASGQMQSMKQEMDRLKSELDEVKNNIIKSQPPPSPVKDE